MTTILLTAPALEPLTLDEVKLHLRIDGSSDDALIMETLKAARQYCELACDTKLITQLWRQFASEIPSNRNILIALRPVQSVEQVVIYDRSGNPTTLDGQQFMLHRDDHQTIVRISTEVPLEMGLNGAEIDLKVGMGDLGVDVPDVLKRATLLLVTHWYEFRGAVSPSAQPVSLPPGFEVLLAPYKRRHL